ncbi:MULTISPECIES: LuxR C-terminal-related transcriptional regulator [unclassified Bradyrhizobium]|uniref:response regulator transcription factor n=1 Tax=unclassified Bradyrhizobium TaxID=2631580 RepID=UPI001FFBD756|nr:MULTISPECIES: LuxR C-terminal-related transcriptional regulator [unclassified Bradyrhizobium]MCK1715942.1 autoinducer binding domain-containing protein [Bradyrhizobium sp. 143]MCK1725740.1 autoinducer binding domain-containing protein [Bradyrhizobium sp. 142]
METADVQELRECLDRLRRSQTFEEATDELVKAGLVLGASKTAWAPDLSRPYFDAEMDAFHRRQGWPDDIMRIWWDEHATLKMPFYIRCRFEHLPFATDLMAADRTSSISPEQRRAATIVLGMGITDLITVPIHLPKGQVAMVTWAGNFERRAAHLLDKTSPELVAIGHFFMDVFLRRFGRRGTTESELARLTPREWECLRLTAQGYREREVANLTGVSATTVRFHLDNVAKKLGASTRTQAVALAAQMGMLGPIGN